MKNLLKFIRKNLTKGGEPVHHSERLLHLHLTIDRTKRFELHQKIKTSLGEGKTLATSYIELTNEALTSNALSTKTAEDFEAWLRGEEKDEGFLAYYIGLLENCLHKQEDVQSEEPVIALKPEPVKVPKETTKPRYVPEKPVPSRAERAHYYPADIQPARSKRRGIKTLVATLLVLLLAGGAYIGYPYVKSFFVAEKAPTNIKEAPPTPVAEEEPVIEESPSRQLWLAEKNVNLLMDVEGTEVAYIGDIGDRYEVVSEEDAYAEVKLGNTTAWAPLDQTTTEWPEPVLTDAQLIDWVDVNVNNEWLPSSPTSYFGMPKQELLDTLGEPMSTDGDVLNEYLFYPNGFFIVQQETIVAIDWTNTGVSRKTFTDLGASQIETDDALVYESPSYSLRLFVGATGQNRIRLTTVQ